MERLSEVVLNKVRTEADGIIQQAKNKAQEEIDKARKQRQARLAEERSRMIGAAEEQAARILAQASIKARQELSSAKAGVIAKIIDGARKELSQASADETHLLRLIQESLDGLGADKVRIYVSPKDVAAAKESIHANQELSSKIVEVREFDCLGGVIVEDLEGKLRIDNTYETRLEMVLPKLLPKVSKELFETT